MKIKLLTLITISILIFSLAACNSAEETENANGNKDDKLTIFTTIYPLQYFTSRIGRDLVNTENIVPPGSDAHSVEITTKTMTKAAESDAFIHTGTGVEGFADSVADSLQKEGVLIVNATESVNLIDTKVVDEHGEEESEDGHDEHGEDLDIDPHFWLDPIRSIKTAETIRDALIELSPKDKAVFESNFSTFKNELEELDSEFKNMVNSAKNKSFIVSHSAYGYWEEAYGLKQISISGLSPTDESSQKKLTELIDLIKTNDIQYIFFEPNLSNKVAEMVKRETGTEALTLNNLESISEENIKNNEDYLVIMRENIKALEKGLNY